MLTVKQVTETNIITEGKVEVDDRYPDIHCEGFEWWVLTILEDRVFPDAATIYGKCLNPDCPDDNTCVEHTCQTHPDWACERCAWRGVQGMELEDLLVRLAGVE